MDDSLLAGAQFERDRRADRYPAIIAADPSRADELIVDYQCWVAIAEWLESDKFMGFHGGAAPDSPASPWISWPQLETAAQKALTSIGDKIGRFESDPDQAAVDPPNRLTAAQYLERLTELYVRRARLTCIHRKVQLHHQMIASINAELRARSINHNQTEGVSA